MNTKPKIYLKKGKETMLERRHPWVFSGALENHESFKEGACVELYTHEKQLVGTGFYAKGSIALRMISDGKEVLSQAFFEQIFTKAWDLRNDLGLYHKDNNIIRLIHGEGDGLGGLVIDVYGNTAVVQAHTAWVYHFREMIRAALQAVLPFPLETIFLSHADNKENKFLLGEQKEGEATENGLKFHIDWFEGQKTGFFIDQRDNRALLKTLSKDKSVLNLFSYTGGFSIYALSGGASKVVSVDSSKKAIDYCNKNVMLNGFKENHQALVSDVKAYLRDNEQFDIIVHDPPAFAKHKGVSHNALQAYGRLNERCIAKVKPGGFLFTFSCSQAISDAMFEGAIRSAAMKVGRPVQVLKKLGQGADHPVSIFHPEGHYLKGLLLRVG